MTTARRFARKTTPPHLDFIEVPYIPCQVGKLTSAITLIHYTHSLACLAGIFYPSNFIYPMTAHFLLQRPELDTSDVPMLYNMLYSSSDDWKRERGWIIRFLSDGMMSSEDWRVLK
jgi:Nucleolar pre-ribosomal-associated protein 1